MKRVLQALAVAVPMAISAPYAQAHSPIAAETSGELVGLVDAANLVVVGTVAEVRYVNARDPETKALVPHAVVTYRVERLLRGKVLGEKSVTIRFIGGPDGQGRFLKVDGVPLFQDGDQDVLFLAGNGEDGNCPLARCEYGRFRISKERVYDTHGSPVSAIVKNSTISRGLPPPELTSFHYPTPAFDDLIQNPEVQRAMKAQGLTPETARARYQEGAPKMMELTETFSPTKTDGPPDSVAPLPKRGGTVKLLPPPDRQPPPSLQAAISVQEFLGVVGKLAQQSHREPVPFKDVDPKAEIRLQPFKAFEPLNIARRPLPPPPVTPSDQAERRAYDAAGGNPVLSR